MKAVLTTRHTPYVGFTLVEVMVSITIAAVLASVAIPSYTQQIRKARRLEARAALLDLAAREERYFSTNSAYSDNAENLGYAGAFPQVIGTGYYQISVCVAASLPCAAESGATGGVFVLTATPIGAQAKDAQCSSFSLDSTGRQSATGTSAATCWNY